MYSSTITTSNIFISPGCFHPQLAYKSSLPFKIPAQKLSKVLNFNYTTRKAPAFFYQTHAPKRKTSAIWTKSGTESPAQPNESSNSTEDDFVTRVLKENPSQVEPKYLIGNRLYTLKEIENLRRNRNSDAGVFGILKRLSLRELMERKGDEGQHESGVNSGDVYLKDILREYKGKLYVPEQVFGDNISEEEEFNRNVDVLPSMTLEDFLKAMVSDKIKLLIFKEDGVSSGFGFMDFVVELKEIPGAKSLQRTKWTMELDEEEAQSVLEEYTGARYEIEKKQMMSWVGKLLENPHPVASKISSRMMVELGMLTAVMAAAAVVIGGFLASAVFAVTSFVFAMAVYVKWPIAKPFLKLFSVLIFGIIERVGDNIADLSSDGGVFSKLYKVYTFGGWASSLQMLRPIVDVQFSLLPQSPVSKIPAHVTNRYHPTRQSWLGLSGDAPV